MGDEGSGPVRPEPRGPSPAKQREKIRNAGWADGLKGLEPQSKDDPEYMKSYRRAKQERSDA